MTKRFRSSKNLAVIELPDLIQSLAQGGRSGVLKAKGEGRGYRIHFRGGMVVALECRVWSVVDALSWLGLTSEERLRREGFGEVLRQGDEVVAQALVKRGVVPRDGIRDAVDLLIEEGLTDVLGLSGLSYDFEPEDEYRPSAWARYQIELETQIAPGGLLMEGLRRQDELKRVAELVPQRWDLLVRDPGEMDLTQFNDHERALIQAWRPGRPAGAVLQLSCLAPWQSKVTAGTLVERDVFRIADAQELIVYGDRARVDGHLRTAEGLYRRAAEIGEVAGRIHLALAELAERRDDEQQAARDYLRAATGLADHNPADGVLAYRSALRLGADRETCLEGLLQIYRRIEETDDATDVLFELASFYEEEDRLDEAMTAVREAQLLGADAVRCGQVLAGLALMADDVNEAVVHLEQVLRTADAAERGEEAAQARRQLLILEPGRCELALRQARILREDGQVEEAAKVIRRSLAAPNVQANEDLLIRLREFLGELDPDDTANHEALVTAYQSRDNRAGAASHLLALAANQERDGDWHALVDTLQQVLGLGGEVSETLVRLARVEQRLGMDGRARTSWRRAVDARLETGDLETAREWAEEAIAEHPDSSHLHERLGTVANRGADSAAALAHYRQAALLALGAGDAERAGALLSQVHALVPEDIGNRLLMIEAAVQRGGVGADSELADFVRFAARAGNLGLAMAYARQRVALAPAPATAARNELVELLRRSGQHQEELTQGRRLLDDLLEVGEVEQALELLQRLVASHPRNADLVLQLAELHEGMGDEADAGRFYRHAVSLLQQEDRVVESTAALDSLQAMSPGDPEVARAREYLDQGLAINWQAIREERAAASKRRIADEAGEMGTGTRRGSGSQRQTGSGRRIHSGTDSIAANP